MPLPKVPYALGAKSNVNVALRGINWTDNYSEGALEDSKNITAVRYPYVSTKAPRERLSESWNSNITAISAWNDLVYVKNNHLYYKVGSTYRDCGALNGGDVERQFVMLYKKLVVWPDKKYVETDSTSPSLKSMDISCSGYGAKVTAVTVDGINYMQLNIPASTDPLYWNVNLKRLFRVRDSITISGFPSTPTDYSMNNGVHQVEYVSTRTMRFAADTMVETDTLTSIEITLERIVPDMDFVCEYGNRLWGCNNTTQTIYCSRMDDPTNFNDYSGEADDSFAFDVSSPGNFTGCCKLGSSVLFWKEQCVHKVLGSYNAEYQMNVYNLHGVAHGCHQSMQVINDVLYYVSTNGVYCYNGGNAVLISQELGEKSYDFAVAGTDGTNYYLSVGDGGNSVFLVYYGLYGMWLHEDDIEALYMTRIGDDVYVLAADNKVYKENGSDATAAVDFLIQFKPLYETVTGSYRRSSVAFGHKRYGKVILRTEMGHGSWAAFDVREDGGVWREVQKIVGATGLSRVVLPIGRADKYEIRIRGNGQFTLKNMIREFRIGSDK